jgi:hypothetical protein
MGRAAASCDCHALRKKSIPASRESRLPPSKSGRLVRFVGIPYKKRQVASQLGAEEQGCGGTRLRNCCSRVVDAFRIPPPKSIARRILPASYCIHKDFLPKFPAAPTAPQIGPEHVLEPNLLPSESSQARTDVDSACRVAEHCLESNVELNVDVGLVLRFGFAAPKVCPL